MSAISIRLQNNHRVPSTRAASGRLLCCNAKLCRQRWVARL